MSESKSFIPDAWLKEMVQQNMDFHDRSWANLREYLDTLPKAPLHKRLWRRWASKVNSAREWMALKIAPWLRRDDW